MVPNLFALPDMVKDVSNKRMALFLKHLDNTDVSTQAKYEKKLIRAAKREFKARKRSIELSILLEAYKRKEARWKQAEELDMVYQCQYAVVERL